MTTPPDIRNIAHDAHSVNEMPPAKYNPNDSYFFLDESHSELMLGTVLLYGFVLAIIAFAAWLFFR